MFPEIKATVSAVETTKEPLKTYGFDYIAGELVLVNGKAVIRTGVEAIKQWIEKLLLTQKDTWKIYSGLDYGTEFEGLIVGQIYPPDLMKNEIEREIKELLERNSYIESVENFKVETVEGTVKIAFEVVLADGDGFSIERRWTLG